MMIELLTVVLMERSLNWALPPSSPSIARVAVNATTQKPELLYKVLSKQQWEASQGQKQLSLDEADRDFIHLATDLQLDRIIAKYYHDAHEYIIVTLNAKKLPGSLIYETNPGSSNQYYHLYDGYIPFKAILNVKKCSHSQICHPLTES